MREVYWWHSRRCVSEPHGPRLQEQQDLHAQMLQMTDLYAGTDTIRDCFLLFPIFITIMKQSTVRNEDLDAQFLSGMDNISIATESDFEDERALEEQERREEEARRLAREKNKMILQELRNGVNMDNAIINEFEQGLNEVVQITRGQNQEVLNEAVLKQIKKKVSAVVPEIVLAEEKILAQTPPQLQHKHEEPKPKREPHGGAVRAATVQNPEPVKQSKLSQKMERMFQEREIIEMSRQDSMSLKYEQDYHSSLLSMRYYTPSIKMVYGTAQPIQVVCPEPAFTYTNLRPQVNNQDNVLSKHSKILAFRGLAALARPRPVVVKVEDKPVVFLKEEKTSPKENTDPLKIDRNKNQQQDDEGLIQEMRRHFGGLANTISNLEEISRNYKPKLLKQHLEGDEKTVNVDIFEPAQSSSTSCGKPLSRFLESMQSPHKLKQLRITFESLTDLSGLSSLPSIQYASLQYNLLTNIDELKSNPRLIEVNLSNNKLKSCNSLQTLKWLRSVDLHQNELLEVPGMPENIQILNLRENRITRIGKALRKAKNMRRVDLSRNRVERMEGMDGLCFLDELDMSDNKVTELAGLDQCVLLRRLLLANNQITRTQKLVLVFLNELDLRNNRLSQVGGMLLPSLQTLYLTNNLLCSTPGQPIYLPSLVSFNADNNKLCGFAPLYHILKYSSQLEIIKYDDNEQLSFAPDKVREFYEHLIYRKTQRLKILNQSEWSIGLKRYYESLYECLLKNREEEKGRGMRGLESKIAMTLAENSLLGELEKNKDPFCKQPEFIWLKSVKVAQNLLQIQKGLNAGWLSFDAHDSILHRLDMFRMRYAASLHKLRSLVIQWKYKKAKRAKYFKKMLPNIQNHILLGVEMSKKYLLWWAVDKFRQFGKFGVGHAQATKIQKVWRGYWLRKRMKIMMDKMKARKLEMEDDEFGDIDLDFFENPVDFDFKLKIPDNFNFDSFIIKPNIFKQVEKLPPIRQQPHSINSSRQLPPLNNNFMNSSSGSSKMSNHSNSERGNPRNGVELPKITKKQQQDKIMTDWNFADPKTALFMQAKADKKRKARERELEKNMTAAERFQKFKHQNKK